MQYICCHILYPQNSSILNLGNNLEAIILCSLHGIKKKHQLYHQSQAKKHKRILKIYLNRYYERLLPVKGKQTHRLCSIIFKTVLKTRRSEQFYEIQYTWAVLLVIGCVYTNTRRAYGPCVSPYEWWGSGVLAWKYF